MYRISLADGSALLPGAHHMIGPGPFCAMMLAFGLACAGALQLDIHISVVNLA
jgi:hypothetical protein